MHPFSVKFIITSLVASFYDISPFVTGEYSTTIDGIAYTTRINSISGAPRKTHKQALEEFVSTQKDIHRDFKEYQSSLNTAERCRFEWNLANTFELIVRIFDAGGSMNSKGSFSGSVELTELVLLRAYSDSVSVLTNCKVSTAMERIKRISSNICVSPHRHVPRDCELTPMLFRSASQFHEKTFGKELEAGVSRIAVALTHLPSQFLTTIV